MIAKNSNTQKATAQERLNDVLSALQETNALSGSVLTRDLELLLGLVAAVEDVLWLDSLPQEVRETLQDAYSLLRIPDVPRRRRSPVSALHAQEGDA